MSVTVQVRINGTTLPGDSVLADVTIRSGRERADDGLEPSTATVELLTAAPGGLAVEIASKLEILVNGALRFTGKVSELTMTQAETMVYTMVAAGNISKLERVLITAWPIPAETAAARASRLITAGGFTATIQGGTTYQMAAYGKLGDSPATAASILEALMSDTGAVVQDGPAGQIIAQFPEARISGDVVTPDPTLTHVDVDFEMTDDLVNEATVTYNPAVPATYVASNAASITKYEKHSVELQTGLSDVGSATRRAGSIVARLAIPAWQVGKVQTWDEAMLAHGVGAVVTLSPLAPVSPIAGRWVGVLEGWTETYQPLGDGSQALVGSWVLSLSDQRHSAESLVWSAVNPAEKWNTVNPATRWQDALSNANL